MTAEEIDLILKRLATLEEENARLKAEVKSLREQLAAKDKNSSTSSKPPSSDIVNPKPKKKGRRKGKPGAKPGHKKHERKIDPASADHYEFLDLDLCPECAGDLILVPGQEKLEEQIELVEKLTRKTLYVRHAYWCEECEAHHYSPRPKTLSRGGLFGARLTALIAWLKSKAHCTYTTLGEFLDKILDAKCCRGRVAKTIQKISKALRGPYEELLRQLPMEAILNIDETGHKENGERMYTWVFRAHMFALFSIEPSRGSDVLYRILGEEFDGVIGSDLFSAYTKYMREMSVEVQFCLAHLIRDVKYLITLPSKTTQNYGNRLLDAIRELFKIIHQRDEMPEAVFLRRLQAAREKVVRIAKGTTLSGKAGNIAARFREYGDAYFTFITTPGMEPTNNLAEQAIRFCVIDRKITQGTRSEKGREACERLWSALATCRIQARDFHEFLQECVKAFFSDSSPPSLLPT
jgi:transposase